MKVINLSPELERDEDCYEFQPSLSYRVTPVFKRQIKKKMSQHQILISVGKHFRVYGFRPSLIHVLVRATITAMKHYNQKQPE